MLDPLNKALKVRIRLQNSDNKLKPGFGGKVRNIVVPALDGSKVPLKEISNIETKTGPAFIYRDNNARYIAVKFSVRGRDSGSAIAEAQQKFTDKIKLPEGYKATWNGEFENQVWATNTLINVVPICLVAIFLILFVTFGNVADSVLVILNVPFALISGILALHITGVNFSISAGIGFIALFGVCIQNGVILISVFRQNLKNKMPIDEAVREGVRARVRAVVMTAMMAAIGLLPAAISTGIGSESQKPLAIVVIGGLVTATILTLMIMPIFFATYFKFIHSRKNRKLISQVNSVS